MEEGVWGGVWDVVWWIGIGGSLGVLGESGNGGMEPIRGELTLLFEKEMRESS